MKIGAELEFWTVDEKGKLTSCEKLTEKLDFAEEEFVKPLFEIKTSPHTDVEELKEEITDDVKKSIEAAERKGMHLVPTGTPLNSGEIETVRSERAELQEEIVGKKLRHAKRVAGLHLHFEKDNTREQLNRITSLDPALALLNSSPYYQGRKVANSSRNEVYRYRCYSDFPKHGQLWEYVDSVEEWEERIEKRFREFKSKARKKGISEEKIAGNFKPEDALWTPVRLRKKFPTVEYRAPDIALPSQVNMFVDDMFEAMSSTGEKELPEFEKVKEISREAIQEGLTGKVSRYLREQGFKTDKYQPLSKKIDAGENLDRKKARKLRLDLAHKMKEDIK